MKLPTIKINRDGLPVVINKSEFCQGIDILWEESKLEEIVSKEEKSKNQPDIQAGSVNSEGSVKSTQESQSTAVPIIRKRSTSARQKKE